MVCILKEGGNIVAVEVGLELTEKMTRFVSARNVELGGSTNLPATLRNASSTYLDYGHVGRN